MNNKTRDSHPYACFGKPTPRPFPVSESSPELRAILDQQRPRPRWLAKLARILRKIRNR